MRPFPTSPGSVHQLSEEAAWPRLGHLEPITVTRGWGPPVVQARVTCPPLGWMGLAGSEVEGARKMEGEGSWTRGSVGAFWELPSDMAAGAEDQRGCSVGRVPGGGEEPGCFLPCFPGVFEGLSRRRKPSRAGGSRAQSRVSELCEQCRSAPGPASRAQVPRANPPLPRPCPGCPALRNSSPV